MDVTRLKKVIAGLSASAIMLTQVSTALAAYRDVASGAWYEEAVNAFVDAGFLDSTQTNFRPTDGANRAEFIKLLVELNGGVLSTPPAVGSFTDVKSSAWYYSYVEEAGKEGWVKGDKDCYGTLPCYARPAALVNRAEAAALIARAFSLDWTGAAPQFVDNPTGQWYTDAVQTAADHCVLQGDDSTGRVRPSDTMNRAEMVVMLHRVDQNLSYGTDCGKASQASIKSAMATDLKTIELDFSTNLDQVTAEMVSHYQVTANSTAMSITAAKLVGDHTVELTVSADLDPSTTYTVAVTDLMTTASKKFSDTATFTGFTATPKGNGTLEVSVSSKNPMGDTVPRGANGVTMLSIDLTASCDDDVWLNDLTLLHEGFGSPSDMDGVYATVNGERVTRKRTVDSKAQTATIHFTTPLNVMKCKTTTLDLMADFSTTATTSGEHNLVVELPSDFDSNAKEVTGTFPMKGKTFKVGAVTSGILTVDARSVSPTSVKLGDTEAVIGKYEFSANSTEDQTLYSVTFQQNGTAKDGDVTNLKVRSADKTVLTNTVASTKGDFVTLVFNPPRVFKSSDRATLELVADISGGANDTVKMEFEESSDIFAVGSLYGYGVNGQLYGSQVSLGSTTATTVTIDAGRFTLAVDGPAQQTFTRDQDAANLGNVKMTAGGNESVNVRHLYIAVQGNTSTGAGFAVSGTTSDDISEVIENVVLKNTVTGRSYTGIRLTTPSSASSTSATKTYQIYRFDDFTVKGAQTFQFNVDFIDNGSTQHPKNGDLFKINICGEPTEISTGTNTTGCDFGGLITATTTYQMQVEGLSSTDAVKDVRPRGNIAGSSHRIASAGLTITQKSTGTSDTAVKNVKNLTLVRFEAKAGEAKDILFTKAIFESNSGSLNNGSNYTLWVDTNSDGVVDTIVQSGVAPVSSEVTFNDLTAGGYVVPKEKTVAFEVHGDIAASLTTDNCSGATSCLQLRFKTSASGYIEAQDVVRGSSLSGIQTNNASCTGTCDISVTTTTAKKYSLVSQGDLFVQLDTVSVRKQQLLGGDTTSPIFRIQLTSRNEGIDVTTLQISASGSTATSIDRLQLYMDGATSSFAEATGCGSEDTPGNATFCAKMQNHQLVVPKNADMKILVRAIMKADSDGGTSNQTIQLYISPESTMNYSTGSGAVRAHGVDSSNNLNRNNGGSTSSGAVFIGRSAVGGTNAIVKGPINVSVLSKITSITNASTSTDGSPIPTGSPTDLGVFKITAAQANNTLNGANKVTLSGVIFNVTANNVNLTPSSFVFYNTSDTNTTSACTPRRSADGVAIAGTASGTFLVDCPVLQNSSVNVTIDPGTSATYALKGTPTATTNSVYNFQVSLQSFDSIANTTYAYNTSHFQWQDKDSSSTATFNWIDLPLTTIGSVIFRN
jgi:hypothetical protein